MSTALGTKKVSVVVLGDVGRSPRMQYHSLSLADTGFSVSVIGYLGPQYSEPLPRLLNNPRVQFFPVRTSPEFKNYVPGFIAYFLKVIFNFFFLLAALVQSKKTDTILVQNPPGIPTLLVCYIYARLIGAKLLIDWHNYTHSMLSLNLSKTHIIVKVAEFVEFWVGRHSDGGFCVTKAMQNDLFLRGIKANLFYDCPPTMFHPVSLDEKHELLLKLSADYIALQKNCEPGETIVTRSAENGAELKPNRPGFLISSTSWTEDEDFSILFNALQMYEDCKKDGSSNLPNILCAVTGKGPLKDFYCQEINRRNWKFVEVITPWLEPEDYPTFLGCADLGVSLHKSSSNLDLPMKIVDMFGVNLPVCAINFDCLHELVVDGKNGFVFETSAELFKCLIDWFSNFNSPDHGKAMKMHLKNYSQKNRWHENWVHTVMPLVND